MRKWIVAFALGILVAGFLPELPGVYAGLILLAAGLALQVARPFRLPAACLLGVGWLCLQGTLVLDKRLTHALEGRDIRITGSIRGLPQSTGYATRFIIAAQWRCLPGQDQLCGDDTTRRLLVNDYGSRQYLPGEHWQLTVRLKRPHGFANPGGYDYEAWLFQQGIAATGYVRDGNDNVLLQSHSRYLATSWFDQARHYFRTRLDQRNLVVPGFIKALAIGDRYGITAQQWQVLTATGTNHLMVISGLHISLVAWLVFVLASRLFAFLPGGCIVLPSGKAGALAALAGAFCYGGLAGFSLPVQRALIMITCVLAGRILERATNPANSLVLALFGVLLVDPLAPQQGGFWLSFVAVACLLQATDGNRPVKGFGQGLRAAIRSQAFIFLGMAPIMFQLFGQLSPVAPLVNLVAIPCIGLVVVPICLAALVAGMWVPALFLPLVTCADFLLAGFYQVLAGVAASGSDLLISVPAAPWWMTGCLAIAMILFLKRRSLSAAIPLVLMSFWLWRYQPARPENGVFQVDILDVGQGLAVVISTRQHTLVYDTGPAYSPRFNAGSGILLPFLQRISRASPDLVIVSHADGDHAGGLPGLMAAFPAVPTWSGEQLPGIRTTPCVAGRAWTWDDIDFRLLAPVASGAEGNAASCVLRVATAGHVVLLPGDIEQPEELALVRTSAGDLASTVLVAPHHGSMTSSTTPFLRQVSPGYAVFSTGYRNRFNHPHPVVEERYRRLGIVQLNTADTGALSIRVTSAGLQGEPAGYRKSRRRFWQDGVPEV